LTALDTNVLARYHVQAEGADAVAKGWGPKVLVP